MKYYLLKITSASVSIEIIDECPSSVYLAKRERKEKCTFELCSSKKAAISTAMQLALDKVTKSKNMLQDVLSVVTQLKESNHDRT